MVGRSMHIKKKKLKYRVLVIAIIIVVFLLNLWRSYYEIQISSYQLQSDKISTSVNLVIISDLHEHVFGKKNKEIIKKIEQQQPDLILVVGDMLNKDSQNAQIVISLVKNLRKIAPVYYSLGNHEIEWENSHDETLVEMLEIVGAVILDETWCETEVNGQIIRLGGLYDYAFSYENIDIDNVSSEEKKVCEFLYDFQNTENFKIMLAHRPESFVCSGATKSCNIDLVVSGHLHGGQVVLPFLGGIYGADQGWFPEYVHGLYEKDNINILITSGLSTNKKVLPRWNNPPEIVVFELIPDSEK